MIKDGWLGMKALLPLGFKRTDHLSFIIHPSVFLISILTFFCLKARCQNADLEFLKKINSSEMPSWDRCMKAFSFSAYPVGFVTPLGTTAHGYFKKDKVLIRNGYKSAITILLAMSISTGMKYTVQRERPYSKYSSEIIARDHSSTFSFPSGHTTAAFASATSLSLTYKKWYVTVPAFAYAGLMGYSRMRLGVHYPSDVLAGAVLGAGCGLLTWKIDRCLRKKHTRLNAISKTS